MTFDLFLTKKREIMKKISLILGVMFFAFTASYACDGNKKAAACCKGDSKTAKTEQACSKEDVATKACCAKKMAQSDNAIENKATNQQDAKIEKKNSVKLKKAEKKS